MTKEDEIKNKEIKNEETQKTRLRGWRMIKKAIIWIIIITILIFAGVFVCEKINKSKFVNEFVNEMALIKVLQDDIKIATLNKDETKIMLKIESKTIIEKINFVNKTGNKVGEIAINDKNIDRILDVPKGTKYLNVSYVNDKDNKILVSLDEGSIYMETYEKEIFVLLKNRAGIKRIEYYVGTQSYEADLEDGQILKELYLPLEVEELVIENGFGEVITLNIKDAEIIEKNSLKTENGLEERLDDLEALKGDYSTIINVVGYVN